MGQAAAPFEMDLRALFAADLLDATPRGFAAGVVERQFERAPLSVSGFGPQGFSRVLDDTEQRLRQLAAAVAFACPALFVQDVAWALEAHSGRGIETPYLAENLAAIAAELAESLPADAFACVEPVLRAARQRVADGVVPSGSLVAGASAEEQLARRFLVAALEGHGEGALELVLEAVRGGLDPDRLAEEVVGRALVEVGRMWQIGEASVAEEHLCSRVAERALAALAALLPRARSNGLRVATLSIGGELHEIGVRLVADRFAAAGWSVLHLGADTPGDHLLQLLRDPGVDLVAVGATLSLHLRNVARFVERVRADREFDRVPILVGGAPFRVVPDLWRAVGADGMAASAAEAVALGARLVEQRRGRG